VGEYEHVAELQRGPFPAAGLALHRRDRGHALERECEEDEQGNSAAEIQVLLERVLDLDRALVGILDTVDGAERAHDHLTCGERRDQADTDLPVEAERLDRGLDDLARATQRTLL